MVFFSSFFVWAGEKWLGTPDNHEQVNGVPFLNITYFMCSFLFSRLNIYISLGARVCVCVCCGRVERGQNKIDTMLISQP